MSQKKENRSVAKVALNISVRFTLTPTDSLVLSSSICSIARQSKRMDTQPAILSGILRDVNTERLALDEDIYCFLRQCTILIEYTVDFVNFRKLAGQLSHISQLDRIFGARQTMVYRL